MKQGLSLRVSQHLALTPQLQQSIRLLQLSTLEMAQEVEQMLDDNPFLERDDSEFEAEPPTLASPPSPSSSGDSRDEGWSGEDGPDNSEPVAFEPGLAEGWDGDGSVDFSPDDLEWGNDALPAVGADFDRDSMLQRAQDSRTVHASLTEHLHRQALALRLSEEDRAALRFLIDSLNEDGYLEDSLGELVRHLLGAEIDETDARFEDVLHSLTMALHLLQSLEPVGVGARHLAECLQLQLRARLAASTESEQDFLQVALSVVEQPLDLLARRDTKRLAQLCHESEARIRSVIPLLAGLEPKPGRPFYDVESQTVVPDVIVALVGKGTQQRFRAQLNPDILPKLKVHDVYANALRQHRGENSGLLQQRLQEARWFIKNIQQRFDTILRVSQAIVERQRGFFSHGEMAMRPLVLREIADELGLHESTISRVTTAKYMATPFGTFELKYFFGSSLGTDAGGNASSTAVRALIKQFIAAENVKKPLSDNQIAEMLNEQGIECARRTVAKYREAMRIAPAKLRKAL